MRSDQDWTPSAPSVRRRVAIAAIPCVMALSVVAGAGTLLRAEQPGPMLMAPSTITTIELEGAEAAPLANPVASLDADLAADLETPAEFELDVDADQSVALPADVNPDEIRWFNGRPIRPVRMIPMRVTAYSPDERSCGDQADGITASGYSVWTNDMKMVAADTRLLPFGALVSVDGYHDGEVVPVLDRGGKIKGRRLDVLYPTHGIARQWGVQDLNVIVWEYADGEPNGFKTNHRRRR